VEQKEKEYGINWIGLIVVIILGSIFAIILTATPPQVICRINNFEKGCYYATWWFNFVLLFFYYLIVSEIKLTKEKRKRDKTLFECLFKTNGKNNRSK